MMQQQIDSMQKAGKEQVDAFLKAFGVTSKGFQAIAVESTDYAKKSFEASTAAFEKLVSAKSLDKAIEVQTEYAKSAFEGYVAQMTKVGELVGALTKDAAKPFEGVVAKATAATK